MKHPLPRRPLHLGLQPHERDGRPYTRFFQPQLSPPGGRLLEVLGRGAVAPELLPGLAQAPQLLHAEAPLEDGYAFPGDASLHLALRTELPGVTPEMVDWWFGWHSEEPQRYKLWHPQAHVHACWAGGGAPSGPGLRGRYQGRTSLVDEYLGSRLHSVAIRFLEPADLGLSEALLGPDEATAVCARIDLVGSPVQAGFLLHHVRRVAGGSEMRSRFWLGGPYGGLRRAGALGRLLSAPARRLLRPTEEEARALLVHCGQEMGHLASFLPALFRQESYSTGAQ